MKFSTNIFLPVILLAVSFVSMHSEPLSIDKAISEALANNYNILITEKDVEVSELNNNWANAGAVPSVDLQGNGSYTGTYSDDPDRLIASAGGSLGVTWLLFDGRGMRIRKNRFEYIENLTKGNAKVIVEATIENVILGYYGALLQKEILEMYAYIRDLSKDRYDYQLHKKELGTAVTYDVLQAQNAYLEDESTYLNQEVIYRDALRNLKYAMAVDPETEYELTEEFKFESKNYELENLRKRMYDDNLNLKNQFINQKLLESDIRAARAKFFPTLSLGAGVDASVSNTAVGEFDPVTADNRGFYGRLNLNFNIFDGGIKRRSLEIAKIEEEIGEIEIRDMKHSLNNRLISLFEYYRVRKKILEVAEEALKAAELNLEISEEKFKNGTINSFNYRDVQRLYLSASISKLNAVYNLIDSQIGLMRITGRLTEKAE